MVSNTFLYYYFNMNVIIYLTHIFLSSQVLVNEGSELIRHLIQQYATGLCCNSMIMIMHSERCFPSLGRAT